MSADWKPNVEDHGALSRPLRGVLLDVDGTLLDSNGAHAHAWVDAFAESRVVVAVERVRWLIGEGGDKILLQVASIDADSQLGKSIARRRQEIFVAKYFAGCRPQPSARALVERLRDEGLSRIVASSAQSEELSPLLRRAGVVDLIDTAASSRDAEESKPDPDIVCAALRRGRLSASKQPGEFGNSRGAETSCSWR